MEASIPDTPLSGRQEDLPVSIESAFAFIEKIARDHQLQAGISGLPSGEEGRSGDDDAIAHQAG
jgi:hypothetical protein